MTDRTAAPPTSELAAFLTRMLDADEAAARAAIEHRVNTGSYQVSGAYLTHGQRAGATWRATYDEVYSDWDDGMRGKIAAVGNFGSDLTAHIARHDPARVLAEVAALRAVVEMWSQQVDACPEDDWPAEGGMDVAVLSDMARWNLRHVAAIWASDPAFDPAWSA